VSFTPTIGKGDSRSDRKRLPVQQDREVLPSAEGQKQMVATNDFGADDLASLFFNSQRNPTSYGDPQLLAAYHSVPMFHAAVHRVATAVAETEMWLQRDGERVVGHPVADLLSQPNPEQSSYEYKLTNQIFVEVLGDSFTAIDERQDGSNQLVLVPPTNVKRKNTMLGDSDGGWRIEHNQARVDVPDDEMIWVKTPDIRDPYGRGTGKGRVLADEIEIDEYAARHVNREFANNAIPSFIMWLPGFDDGQSKSLAHDWRQLLRGPDNTGKGVFKSIPASDPEMDFTPIYQEISRKLDDMGAEGVRRFTSQLILRCFGVPPEILGIVENSNRATIEAADFLFSRWTLKPRLQHLKDEWEQKLLPKFPDTDGMTIEFKDPVPENRQFQLEVAKEFPEFFTGNEVRSFAGLGPRPDMDVVRRKNPKQAIYVPVEDIDGGPAQPAKSRREQKGGADNIIELSFVKQDTPDPQAQADEIVSRLTPGLLAETWGDTYDEEVMRHLRLGLIDLGVEPPEQFKQEGAPERYDNASQRVQEHVDEFTGERVVGINETTRKQIAGIVGEGLAEGKGALALVSELDALYLDQIIPERSLVIARTEMTRAANFGTWQSHAASGVVQNRQWIAAMDSRTRDTHLTLHNTTKGINEPFKIGTDEAMYPGDFTEPENSINCRCTTIAKIEIEGMAISQRQKFIGGRIKEFEERRDRSTDVFVAAVRDGLRRQRAEQLIPAMEDVLDVDLQGAA